MRFQTVAQEMQGTDDFANRAEALLGVHNPSMFVAGRMMTQEVLVLRKDDSVVGQRKCDMFWVGSRN
jgi:hypothetical protein